jgi:hypothetical protein
LRLKSVSFLTGLLLNSGLIIGQSISSVSAIGSALIYGDVSPNQARIQALNDAKINALKNAGITEHISSYQLLYTTQVKNDISQLFNSDVITEMEGAVKSYEIKKERVFFKNELELVCEITIDATVIKYDTKPDPGFDIQVSGIKPIFSNNENLSFNVKTTKPGYLTVFNISDTDASVLFPNPYEKQVLCKANEACQYPVAKINYTLHTDMKQPELNRLIFVFTKTQIPFIKFNGEQVTTKENIFSWIYSISPDQRKIEYVSLTIQN